MIGEKQYHINLYSSSYIRIEVIFQNFSSTSRKNDSVFWQKRNKGGNVGGFETSLFRMKNEKNENAVSTKLVSKTSADEQLLQNLSSIVFYFQLQMLYLFARYVYLRYVGDCNLV
jgi:hypothetical protein